MALDTLKKALGNVRFTVEKAQASGVSLAEAQAAAYSDFQAQRRGQLARDVMNAVAEVEKEAEVLHGIADEDSEDELKVISVLKLVHGMKNASDMGAIRDGAHLVRNELTDLEALAVKKVARIDMQLPTMPPVILGAVQHDYEELKKCFDAGCYRSCVILCGRMLETVLHRKYFDATGVDLLEKAPGTGLGNLIRKLADKNVVVDPGLTNQIHVINQVRVHSVHVKKDAHTPTKEQAHAIALYTLDVIRKLF